MKWKLLPPALRCPLTLSKPYAQSIPIIPNIGKKIRTPTPAERLRSKGLYPFIELNALPASRKVSA